MACPRNRKGGSEWCGWRAEGEEARPGTEGSGSRDGDLEETPSTLESYWRTLGREVLWSS